MLTCQDEERLKKAVNTVPTHAELNAMLARSEEERAKFDRMDAELWWPPAEGARPCACTPDWLVHAQLSSGVQGSTRTPRIAGWLAEPSSAGAG